MAADRAMFAASVLTCRRGTCLMMRRNTVSAVSRWLAAGNRLECFNRVPLDLDRDPVLGTVLSDDLIDALANRCIRLGSPHAPEIEVLQSLYRVLDPLLSIARVALLLLARSVPVNDKPLAQMIGTDSTFDDVEDLFLPIRPLAQNFLPAHITSKHGLGKCRHFGTVLGNDGNEEPTFAIDRAQVLLCAQLAVGNVDEVWMLQQGAQPVPCLQMDPVVGLVPVVGLEVHGHCAIGRYAQAEDELLEMGAPLLCPLA